MLKRENAALRLENAALRQENQALRQQVETLQITVNLLMAQVKELTDRLNKNSSNSHKPPSSEGYRKQPAFKKETKGIKGGQKGHQGNTLQMVSQPDYTIPVFAEICICGHDIRNEPKTAGEQRQVFDIPAPKIEVTAYQQYTIKCPCCQRVNVKNFPEDVNAPVQYGNRLRALSVLLNNDYKVPVGKIGTLVNDLYGVRPNEASIVANNGRCYDKLEPIEQSIKDKINSSAVAHADETGVRVEGKLHWFHTTSTELFSYFYVHAKRGSEAINDTRSIIAKYTGTLVHDCYKSYFKLTNLKHALCGAHILRELTAQIEDNKQWAVSMKDFLLELLRTPQVQNVTNKLLLEEKYDAIIAAGKIQEPIPEKTGKRGKTKKTKGLNLLERLEDHKQSVLAFAYDPDIPFTNNLAERDIRPTKIKMKVSNTFRSSQGAHHHARIAGFTSTLRKQNLNVFSSLLDIFTGKNIALSFST